MKDAEQQQYLRHLPRFQHSVFSHCQPLHSSALTSNHISSRHIIILGVGLGVAWRCLQISVLLAYLGVGSHNVQQVQQVQMAQVAKPRDRQSHPITSHPAPECARPLSTPKTNRTKDLLQRFSGVLEALLRRLADSSA
jgi:hypothetical protein